jgi:hypothetical protein
MAITNRGRGDSHLPVRGSGTVPGIGMKELHFPRRPDPRKPHIFVLSGMWMVYIFPGFDPHWVDKAKAFTEKKNNPQGIKQLDLRYNERRHG